MGTRYSVGDVVRHCDTGRVGVVYDVHGNDRGSPRYFVDFPDERGAFWASDLRLEDNNAVGWAHRSRVLFEHQYRYRIATTQANDSIIYSQHPCCHDTKAVTLCLQETPEHPPATRWVMFKNREEYESARDDSIDGRNSTPYELDNGAVVVGVDRDACIHGAKA